ncbi:hypothetical protein GCM10017673_56540 [Streptosporangium violaceochromogenes]|nr:hypothetical protein GCM10017673_56540 [Streptosporangium violaceochromogenes]
MNWNPRDHPRDDDGKFASGGGGGGGAAAPRPSGPGRGRRGGLGHLGGTAIGYAASHNSGSRSSDHSGGGGGPSGGNPSAGAPRGMPTAVASDSVQLTKGGNATLERHANGGLSIGDGTRSSKPLTSGQSRQLLDTLGLSEDWPPGEEEALPGVGRVTRQRGGVQLDLDDGFSLSLTHRDARRLEVSADRLAKASRVDTGHGELDVFPDGKKIGFRHLDGDGRPVEAVFTRSAADKISSTIDRFIDDMDDPDLPVKDVYSKDISTNLGKVRVTLQGNWGSTNPGDRLTITPVDGGDWGITVDGSRQRAWSSALDDFLDEAAPGAEYNLTERVPLTEAAGGQRPAGRRFRARIIKGDVQGSSGYYPAATLRRDASVFAEGLPVFLDHPSVTESHDRPERSVRDLAGRLASTARYEGDGLYADVEVYPHWAPVIEAMADHIGLSIRASGTVEASRDEGIPGPIVTSLAEAASVDFVTAAGAGGKIVALLESARAEAGEFLRLAAEAKGVRPKGKAAEEDPEAKPGGTKAEDETAGDENEPEDDEDTTAKKKGRQLPAFLKAKEAAVGHWLESRIHRAFTEMADDMYGDGRLTRDERIGLSQAVGDGLKAFTARLETDHPHLYQRDLWGTPEQGGRSVTTENTAKGAPVSGSTEKQTPPDRGGLVINELTVTESGRERQLAAELAEATKAAETAQKALTEAHAATAARVAALEATLTESAARAQRLENDQAARKVCAEALQGCGLPEAAHAKVTEAVARDIPTGENGVLDSAALAEAVKAAIRDEEAYLAAIAESAGLGQVRGLGEARCEVADADIDSELEEAFRGLGMSDTAAKVAAHGRA